MFAETPEEKKIFPYKYETVILENGLKVIVIPMDSPGLVSYYSVVRTGSRDEYEPGKSGFAHFFEHMMFRGTERFPGSAYDSLITGIGADANAYTSDDLTVYHLNFAKEDLALVMDLESDRFRNLKYSKEQFQTESGAVYGEYRKGRTSPWSVAFEAMNDMAFDVHTYKHTTIGFEADIKDMPNQYDYSISFYKRYYRPENVVITVVGDVTKSEVETLARKFYTEWKTGYVKPDIKAEPKQNASREKVVEYEGRTLPLIMVGYKVDAFSPENKEYVSLSAFSNLAFGETSELYKKLVLDEQKVQFVSADAPMNRDPYLFTVYAMVNDEKDIEYVREEIAKTIESFKTISVDAGKLENFKKRNRYGFLMALDSPDAVASILPQFITLSGGIDVIDSYYTAMEQITPETLKQSVQHYFVPSNKNTIVLKGR